MNKRWLFTPLVIILMLSVTSCAPDDEGNPDPTNTANFTSTATSTNTPTPTNSPTNTPTPTATEIPCFTLIAPEDGTMFGTMGLITFKWTEQFGASKYQIEIALPSGKILSKFIDETSYERYLESLPPGGEYFWRVIALDETDVLLCSTEPFSFTKPSNVSSPSEENSYDCDDSCNTDPPWQPGGGTPAG